MVSSSARAHHQLYALLLSFSLLLQDLYYFTLISSLYAQPIISEAKTARAFINGCAPYGSRLYSNDQTGQWDCAYPFRAYLRGALYFTKALKPSQFLVIDLTLRALTQPKTRAFTTASGSSLPAQLLARQGTFYATNPSHKRDDYRRACGGTWRPQPQPVTGFTQSCSVELIDAGCSKGSVGQRLLSFSLYYSAITNDKPHIVNPYQVCTPVVVYRKSILSRTALIIYGRIRARQWVQRAVTLRRREVYETSLRTSSLCQVIGALRTPTEWH